VTLARALSENDDAAMHRGLTPPGGLSRFDRARRAAKLWHLAAALRTGPDFRHVHGDIAMLNRPLTTTLAAIAVAATAACSTTPSAPGYYSNTAAPAPAYARPAPYSDQGVVRAIDVIPVASRPVGAGAILGAIVGGVVGNQFGSGSGRALTTIGGAVAGGVAGNAIEKKTRKEDEVFRVSVRFDDGSIRDFDYQQIGSLRVGDRVRLVDGQLHMLQ
jgi:outer membrane lipoprotein SlyB